jgi:phage/plasmid-associated DNA primase
VPEAVSNTTKSYREAEDWIGNFIYECCEVGRYEEQGGKLYDAYVEWCEKNNEYKRRPRDFAAALEVTGYEKRRTMHGSAWSGLRLISQNDKFSNRYKAIKPPTNQDPLLDDDELDEIARKGM